MGQGLQNPSLQKVPLLKEKQILKRIKKKLNKESCFYVNLSFIVQYSSKRSNLLFQMDLIGSNLANFFPNKVFNKNPNEIIPKILDSLKCGETIHELWQFLDKSQRLFWAECIVTAICGVEKQLIEVIIHEIEPPIEFLKLLEESEIIEKKIIKTENKTVKAELDLYREMINSEEYPEDYLELLQKVMNKTIEITNLEEEIEELKKERNRLEELEVDYTERRDEIYLNLIKTLNTRVRKLRFEYKKLKKMNKNEVHNLRRIIGNLQKEKSVKKLENEGLRESIPIAQKRLELLIKNFQKTQENINKIRTRWEFSQENFLIQKLTQQYERLKSRKKAALEAINMRSSSIDLEEMIKMTSARLQKAIMQNTMLSLKISRLRSTTSDFVSDSPSDTTSEGRARLKLLARTSFIGSDYINYLKPSKIPSLEKIEIKSLQKSQISSFEELIENHNAINYFKEFLSQSQMVETLLFFLECRKMLIAFNENPESEDYIQWRNEIEELFCFPDSLFAVECSGTTIEEMFNSSEKILKEIFLQFKKSDYFYKLPPQNELSTSVIKGIMITEQLSSDTLNSNVDFVGTPRNPITVVSSLLSTLIEIIHANYSPSEQSLDANQLINSIQFKKFVVATSELININTNTIQTKKKHITFMLNLYNLMSLHSAFINEVPYNTSSFDRFRLETKYLVAKEKINLIEIAHNLLNSKYSNPLVLFAMISFQDDTGILHIYEDEYLNIQLKNTCKAYILRNIKIIENSNIVKTSHIFTYLQTLLNRKNISLENFLNKIVKNIIPLNSIIHIKNEADFSRSIIF